MGFDSDGGSSGVSDHGDLQGLADDDHTQYIRGDRDPLAIPDTAGTPSTDSVLVGPGTSDGGERSTVVGDGSSTNGQDTVVVGQGITNAGNNSNVIIGSGAGGGAGNNNRMVIIGEGASGTANNAIAIGRNTSVTTQNVGRVGVNQWVFGAVQDTIADADLNNNQFTVDIDESNTQFILRAKEADGTLVTGTVGYT